MPVQESAPAPALGPARPKERIEVVDILRGFALFGVLLINMWNFSSGYLPFREIWTGTADQATYWLAHFFAETKFWSLFSFLFGLGFALQMGRAESRGVRFFSFYRRRLFALLLFGLVHSLVYPGDILLIYAMLGFLLLLFRARSPRTLLVAAFVLTLGLLVRDAVITGTHELRRADPQTAQQVIQEDVQREAEGGARREKIVRVRSHGTFGEITVLHAQLFAENHSLYVRNGYIGWLGEEFVMFLLGLYAGRRRIFQNLPQHLPFIRKVMWWGLGLGLVCTSVNIVAEQLPNPAWPYLTGQLGNLLWAVGRPGLCFFYVASITLLVQQVVWKTRLVPLAALGRMALMNYLMQTVVCVTIFYSYGFGLYGKVGPAGCLGLTVIIYSLQIPLSIWWLGRFRFGPAEWLWRTLTYGKLQPMRVSQPAA